MATIARSTFPILFIKALKHQSGYALYGNPPRWHKVGADKPAPADAHHVAMSHYHVAAVKKLQADGMLHGLAPHEQTAKVKGLAAEMQAAASQSAAVSTWKKAAAAGQNPTPAQWKAFYALPKDKQDALLDQIGQATGGKFSHLSAPDAPAPEPEPAKPHPSTLALAAVDWAGITLPDSNVNAGTVNKKVAALKEAASTGDAEKVAALKFGVNTYGKKLAAAQSKILAALGAPAAAAAPAPKVTKVEANTAATPAPLKVEKVYAAAPKAAPAATIPHDPLLKMKAALIAAKTPMEAQKAALEHIVANGETASAWEAAIKFLDGYGFHISALNLSESQGFGAAKKMLAALTDTAPASQPPRVAKVSASGPSSITLHHTSEGHNKFYKVTVDGEKLTKHWGKIGTAGMTTTVSHPSAAHALSAAHDLTLSKQKKGYFKHEGGLPASVDAAPAPKVASVSHSGPKEGDTKHGADGMLVLKHGRWVKADQGQPAQQGVTLPEFPSQTFSLKDGVWQGHDTGTGAAFKVAPGVQAALFLTQGIPVPASLADLLPDSKKAALVAEVAGKFGKSPMDLQALMMGMPASGAATHVPDADTAPLDISGWKQVGPQAGSNPGGVFEAPDGSRYYVKFPKNADHARSEVLAAKLYELAGVPAPISRMAVQNGKVGIASLMDTTLKHDAAALAGGKIHSIKPGFAVDAWLANYDVAGLTYDNVMLKPSGQAVRIDVGASMEFRAQGKKKAFGPKVTETASLLDPKTNAQAASMFAGITPADIAAGVAKIAAVPDQTIRDLVLEHGYGTAAERAKLADTLIARKADLLKQYPAAAKAVKKKLDPKRLPVDPGRLPKLHDFSNWNGPGKGLSSKEHVNAANAAVEQDLLALAKKGDLVSLRAFTFKSLNKETGQATGTAHPISEHPSKHVVQLHQDLVTLLEEIANPPEPLKLFRATEAGSVSAIAAAFPPKKFGTTVGKVKSNEKLGFWVALGQVSSVDKFKPKKVSHFTANAIAAAKEKFKQGSALARHFISSVQASGSYNDLFRNGKETDHSGHKLKDVAKAALEHATSQPEGTSLYRWQNMTDAMVQQVLKAPVGTVIQATGPMCTSYSPTATQHFGKHRVTIRYADGAKGVESFGSGKYAGEKEVTTLPNSRFVVLSRGMVDSGNGHQRLDLELLMLPPDLGL